MLTSLQQIKDCNHAWNGMDGPRQERLRAGSKEKDRRNQSGRPARILVVYIYVTTMDDKYDCIVRRCFSSADARRRVHSPAGRPAGPGPAGPDSTSIAVGPYAPLRSVHRYANGAPWLPRRPAATYATTSIRLAGPSGEWLKKKYFVSICIS